MFMKAVTSKYLWYNKDLLILFLSLIKISKDYFLDIFWDEIYEYAK